MDRYKIALEKYFELIQKHPALFSGRKERKIITDKKNIEQYIENFNIVLGVVAENKYVYFIEDLVEASNKFGDKIQYTYFRIVSKKQLNGGVNVVVLGLIKNRKLGEINNIVLVNQERHATGLYELALPRGFGESNINGEDNALKELKEETGYIGIRKDTRYLGKTYTDSGLTNSLVYFYVVPIVDKVINDFEVEEAIENVQLLSIKDTWEKIEIGNITDSFTIQALAFYEKKMQFNFF